MRKERNKNRKPKSEQGKPSAKRRKTGEETFSGTPSSRDPEIDSQEPSSPRIVTEKRKEELKTPAPKRLKLTQDDIRKFLTKPITELLSQPETPELPHQIQQLPNPILALVQDTQDPLDSYPAPDDIRNLLTKPIIELLSQPETPEPNRCSSYPPQF